SYINDVMTGKVFKVKGTNFDKRSASLAQWLESKIMVNNSPYLEKLARSIMNNKKLPYGLTLSPELNQEIQNGQFNEKS
ncbi:hypothetical protein, partial [Bacillus cereus]|uniref:hypothetical protein n=1 Tax=Bacillus cereus TaxID=1396 RepID=UPI0034D7111A